ncbi:zinc ribbon domain-containing protein [Cupriavidus cauae]|uniref:Zinc ribbon domain-containing protein n=1 Tax=Cupriavidus cauae TaxID=2608999 RepID=A0A5M8AAH3_9BURK|nr:MULTISPECIES: FmdB family zinc ribbon protein [Cupriavidus]KAA0180980.1 zinc ribbon domain-containing protein [Cupriavidus gilardii]KAA6119271.1 zinc ribbon domain-containing protein [Cupriavidus cauae]MCA7085630.1 zinc ribbon domain-containing protein [Cupriavidus sp. DB3]UZN50149.1 zinc ribbon domain-containing protein [Cupriavidus cauae]
MPIYAYRCDACGHGRDVLQKMSDAPLTDCPSCNTAGAFKKQLTAAGFQLKGSGWYVTDFRGGNTNNGASTGASSGAGSTGDAGAAKPAETSASASAAPAAGGCGSACACH